MKFYIDYNDGSFAVKISQIRDSDFDILNEILDEDFAPLDLKEHVFEFVGDEREFIKGFGIHVGWGFIGGDIYTYTDKAVKHIMENADVIENEYARLGLIAACAKRLGLESERKAAVKRRVEIMTAYDEEIKANRKRVIRTPRMCADGEDCYKCWKEHSRTDFETYMTEKCALGKKIRQAKENNIPYEIKVI